MISAFPWFINRSKNGGLRGSYLIGIQPMILLGTIVVLQLWDEPHFESLFVTLGSILGNSIRFDITLGM